MLFMVFIAGAIPQASATKQSTGERMEQKYSPKILSFIKREEGFVSKNDNTAERKHEKTTGTHGAYYDSQGNLTTGFGSKVSTAPKGSKREAKDIEAWTKEHTVDPFSLGEKAATRIITRDIDKNLGTAIQQLQSDEEGNLLPEEERINFEELPEPVQLSVVSLSYNTGELGKKTASLIRKAQETKTQEDWEAVAQEFRNWHGNKTKNQPPGVIKRRQKEAESILTVKPIKGESKSFASVLSGKRPKIPGLDKEENPQVIPLRRQKRELQQQTSGRLNARKQNPTS